MHKFLAVLQLLFVTCVNSLNPQCYQALSSLCEKGNEPRNMRLCKGVGPTSLRGLCLHYFLWSTFYPCLERLSGIVSTSFWNTNFCVCELSNPNDSAVFTYHKLFRSVPSWWWLSETFLYALYIVGLGSGKQWCGPWVTTQQWGVLFSKLLQKVLFALSCCGVLPSPCSMWSSIVQVTGRLEEIFWAIHRPTSTLTCQDLIILEHV